MSTPLRIILILGAVWLLFYVLRSIHRSRMHTGDSFFWIAVAALFVVMGAFPNLVFAVSGWIGVESPANFLFLVVVFVLIVKVFTMDRKVAKLQHQMLELAQKTAIKECDETKNFKADAIRMDVSPIQESVRQKS